MEIEIKELSISKYLDKYSLLEKSQNAFFKIKFQLTDTSGVLGRGWQMCGSGRLSKCIL